MKSIAKNSIFNSLYTILNLLFPLISSMYVSRILMADGVGKVAYAQNIVAYFLTFSSLGLPSYGLREIAKVRNDVGKKNKIFTELIIINTVLTVIAFAGLVLLVFCVENLREQMDLFIACGVVVVLNIFNIDWLYQAEEEYAYIVSRSLLIKIISLCALFLLVKTKSDYITYAWITSLATGGNYLFNVLHARKYVKLDFSNILPGKHVKPLVVMGAGVLLASIYAKIDVTMLGAMTDDINVGYYSYAHKIVWLVCSVAVAITTVFLPRLSFYYKNDTDRFNELLDKGIRGLLFLSPPLMMGFFLLAPDIMLIFFGVEFVPAAVTTRILAVLIMVKSFGDLLCFQLVICTGNEKEILPASFFASLFNIILNAILIPLMAERGAAIASVVSEMIVNGYQFKKMKKLVMIKFNKNAVVQSVTSTLIMSIIVMLVSSIEVHPSISLIVSAGAGIVTYFCVNKILKNEFMDFVIFNVINKLKVRRKEDAK